MYQDAASVDVGFDHIIKGIEESSDIFIFAIQQGVHYMQYSGVKANVVHVLGCCHDFILLSVPVVMFLSRRASRSNADCTSPMYIWFEVRGCVKTESEGWYSSSRKLSNIIIIERRIYSNSRNKHFPG